ncbi:serine protease 53 [Diabrotica virgifera virgifera]|uniref:Peptidase S1 domain-containing protein n=3 Tax=Diabrotica virgifera virgifera TaxID=50390 RepID=A0ABM5INL4_DIAVI|nr:serine protease 53 [Diabrotica virgifera virgifera]
MSGLKYFVLFALVTVTCARHVSRKSTGLKINGGSQAKSGQFPFVASLELGIFGIYENECEGVILNENWVLTSGECAKEVSRVVAGVTDLHGNETSRQVAEVEHAYVHPEYDSNGPSPNDIALVKLKTPLVFNQFVGNVSLPEQDAVFNGTANLTGWGWSFLPDFNKLSFVADLPLIDIEECNRVVDSILEENTLDKKSNICAGDLDKGANNCDGDVGGSLTQNGVLIGIVTWYIEPCDIEGTPDIFTNVANFVDWINQTIDKHQSFIIRNMVGLKVFVLFALLATTYGFHQIKFRNTRNGLGLDGATEATDGQFPWVVSLQSSYERINTHVCGGVILTENWVLTSAECEGAVKVVAGAVKPRLADPNKQTVDVERWVVHPDYNSQIVGPNDIALVKLKQPLKFTDAVKAANLPEQGAAVTGLADVVGYGNSARPDFNNLTYISDLPLISYDDCNQALEDVLQEKSSLDEKSNICAGVLANGANNCDGDTGSPLTQDNFVIGITSWFISPCQGMGAPNVFTNVANFVDWINENISQ